MFPTSNSILDNPHLPYTNQIIFTTNMSFNYSYDDLGHHDPNPNSITPQDVEDAPFSLNFPSPFLDENQLFFSPNVFPADHHRQLMAADDQNHEIDTSTEEIPSNTATEATNQQPPVAANTSEVAPKMKKKCGANNNKKGPTPRRSGKKDRHSKIHTAHGLRDRRMRLSLQIARKFFDLQDMLGFDKASKTIDWLFSKSKRAIKQLSCTTNQIPQIALNNTAAKEVPSMPNSKCKEKAEHMRKVTPPPPPPSEEGENIVSVERKIQQKSGKATTAKCCDQIAKETRDKARARARERTREKMMIRCLEKSEQYLSDHQANSNSCNLAQLGPTTENPNPLFETGGREESMSSVNQEYYSNNAHVSLQHQLATVSEIIENFLGTTTSASSSGAGSSSIFDYQQKNDGLLLFSTGLDSYNSNSFIGNWDISTSSSNSAALMTSNMVPMLNPSSMYMDKYSCYHHQFQSQNQDD